ncbi:5-carboxymethyl-2-hydroxymuconate isomerase [Cohnella sp. CIP 111063]|uniref:fumarylacetoacetate hydrolase family protein n=1 Tax=unclassified Cohnella TaxID=2636738 RepID=UPI000B8BF387|nr:MULTISPECIES: fumarylacetoacetate hydrolase family protein [unclassified Cohnella]OXS53700.1 5-carboxymethyl-2-hydroxymuconate isomerase [Cohnella sp. CIP 111063]PRX61986.1 2-keto-4-pentenoate hydratase/2-oxohepta-3-ene-1,7-dioic acid hydratase in catechol pathway [Cohnella sp. SGD-V74]
MKLLTFIRNGRQQLGVKTDAGVVDLAGAGLTCDVMEVIEGGAEKAAELERAIGGLDLSASSKYVLDESALEWGPCVTRPNKIICVGLNYRKHAEETNAPIPEYPILFNKFNNTLTGHLKPIVVPEVTRKLDYEAELAVVIGKRAKNVAKESALEHVFGYACVNDLSARDLQLRTHQWLLGKTCDDFSPLGPYLVTADEVGNPNALAIRAIVNGEVRQSSNTSDMIFYVDEIVSYISRHMTLVPGDVILTGTPEGVVLGLPPERQVYLQPGDEVTIEIEKLGSLTNRFVAEL